MKNKLMFLSLLLALTIFSSCQKDTPGDPEVDVPTNENLAKVIEGTYVGLHYDGEQTTEDFQVEIIRVDNVRVTWQAEGWEAREVLLMRDQYLTNGIVSVADVNTHIVAYLPDTREISITVYDENGELQAGFSGEKQ